MMAQLRKAPWARRRLSAKEMTEVIGQMRNQQCWRFGKYLGSMLFFDFGDRIVIPGLRGGVVEAGTATLGIRDCFWELRQHVAVVADSNSITDESAEALASLIVGTELVGLKIVLRPNRFELIFSSNMVLSVDTTNRYNSGDPIIELTAGDGRIYEVSPRGLIYLADRVSTARFTT